MREREQAVRALLDRPGLQKVFSALAGDEVRVVGGAVRNALLGEPVADIDLAVAAVPQDVLGKAEGAGLRVVPTGIDHGTLTLIVDGAHFEITSLREDVETDGRRAKVRFGGDFAADARRRDFTINALSVDARGQLHDYVGGLDDLAARRVRFIGDPEQRIAEDYLRILRFFRFSACYGEGPLDRDGLHACIARREGIATLSRERLGGEMLKILASPRSCAVVETMSAAGLLAFLGVAPWPARGRRVAAHSRGARRRRRPAVAGRSCLAQRLPIPNALPSRCAFRARKNAGSPAWPRSPPPGMAAATAPAPAQLREQIFRHGAQAARDGLILNQAEIAAAPDSPEFLAADGFLRDTPAPKPPFAATDLIARGIRQGAGLGDALKRLQAAWIRAGFPQDPKQIAGLIDEACELEPAKIGLDAAPPVMV